MFAIVGLASILAIGAAAQQQIHTFPSQPNAGMMGQEQRMMGGGTMMGMMGQMMANHQQMTELMNKLMQNMTAIQDEDDPATLKAKIAEEQALFAQMHDQMTQQGGMMQKMSGQIPQSCPMASATPPPSDQTPGK